MDGRKGTDWMLGWGREWRTRQIKGQYRAVHSPIHTPSVESCIRDLTLSIRLGVKETWFIS